MRSTSTIDRCGRRSHRRHRRKQRERRNMLTGSREFAILCSTVPTAIRMTGRRDLGEPRSATVAPGTGGLRGERMSHGPADRHGLLRHDRSQGDRAQRDRESACTPVHANQPAISQGRLKRCSTSKKMGCRVTGFEIANANVLEEAQPRRSVTMARRLSSPTAPA